MNISRFSTLRSLIFLLTIASLIAFNEFALRFALPEFNPRAQLTFLLGTDERPPLGPKNAVLHQSKNSGDYNVVVRFNELGLRDPNLVSGGTASDIYLVGDSYPFGWGVPQKDSVASQLDALYGGRVFNLSIPGDFEDYDKLLRYAAAQGADLRRVILFVTMENDLNSYDVTEKIATSQPITHAPEQSAFLKLKGVLTKNSAMYQAVTSVLQQSTVVRNALLKLGLVADNLEGARGDKNDLPTVQSAAARLARLKSQYDMLVVIAPSRVLWSGNKEEQANALKWHETFISELKARGVRTLDLRTLFDKSPAPLDMFFKNDPHWRPNTHHLIAQDVFDNLPAEWKN